VNEPEQLVLLACQHMRAPHIGRRRGDSEQIRNTLPVPGVFRKMGRGPYDAPR
jgi:hypothetical protein